MTLRQSAVYARRATRPSLSFGCTRSNSDAIVVKSEFSSVVRAASSVRVESWVSGGGGVRGPGGVVGERRERLQRPVRGIARVLHRGVRARVERLLGGGCEGVVNHAGHS